MTTVPMSAPSPFRGPVRWALLECAHYGVMETRSRPGSLLPCVTCGESRRMVKPVERGAAE